MRGLAALAVATAAACAPPAAEQATAPPALDSAAVTAAVSEVWARLSAAVPENNVDAILAQFSPTARYDYPAVPPMLGRAGIDSVVRPIFATRDFTGLVITPAATYVVSNDMAYARGSLTESWVENGKPATEYCRFAAEVVKEADGQWRIRYMMAFPDSIVQGRQP